MKNLVKIMFFSAWLPFWMHVYGAYYGLLNGVDMVQLWPPPDGKAIDEGLPQVYCPRWLSSQTLRESAEAGPPIRELYRAERGDVFLGGACVASFRNETPFDEPTFVEDAAALWAAKRNEDYLRNGGGL